MQFLAVVTLALAVLGAGAAPRADVDVAGDVEAVIKTILDALSEPLFDVADKNFTIDLSIETISGILKEIKLGGIKALDIETLDYDKETSRLDYSFNFADIEGILDVELLLQGLISFDHHPIISTALGNLRLAGYAVVDVESTPNQVTDLSLLVTLDTAQIDASGILNNDDLSLEISELLTKELPTIVNDLSTVLAPIVNPVLKAAINIILDISE